MSDGGRTHKAPEPMLTVEQAAQLAGFAPVTIQRHIRAGRLGAVRLAHQYRIPVSEWEKFLQANKVTGRPALVREKKRAASGADAAAPRIPDTDP